MNDDAHYVGLGEPTQQVTLEIERWGNREYGFFSAEGEIKLCGQTYWFWFSFASDIAQFGVFPGDAHRDNCYMGSSTMLYGFRLAEVTGVPTNCHLNEGEAAVLLMDFAIKFALSQFGTPAQ